MKAEYKKAWVGALRSGKYHQTTSTLTRIDENGTKSHCCLGLLCDIVKDDLGLLVEEKNDRIHYDYSVSVLPASVSMALDLDVQTGVPSYKFFLDPTREDEVNIGASPGYVNEWISADAADLHLASLNDSGLTFDQIADIIEWAEPEA